ncbi:hypothetical protein [uncultured Dokdonia sp.]|uniref:hypothetical protein n=1 Tax=uncultured Dokdonia sp. TaxID=575653 RepID=UPI0026331DBE|nr:hypothetical protein [uncultured Dokdonia sp.]
MIFYNPQLITDTDSATLFCVQNAMAFNQCDDHFSGIYLHLFDLIEKAIKEKENVTGLIEDYLEIPYSGGQNAEELTTFIFYSDPMNDALATLRVRWKDYDPTIEQEGLTTASDISKLEAIQRYSYTTLRSYLEALTTIELD